MKIIEILYENTKGNERFINALIPKLTQWYENLYVDTDWFNAAYNTMYSNKEAYEYRAAAMNANIQIQNLKELLDAHKNVLDMEIDDILSLRAKLIEKESLINDNLRLVAHLKNLFGSGSSSKGNFMEIYSVPPGIMIELWERWKKEVYDPESFRRERNFGGKSLIPISSGDFMGYTNPNWKPYNPEFGQRNFWKTFNTHGMGDKIYVTSSYLETSHADEPLMYDADNEEDVLLFIDRVEMEMAIDQLNQYFTDVDAKKVIDYIRSQPSWQYDDEELDVNEEIGLDIKKYVDEHPEIHFETDGDTDGTFTYIGQILNDYLHY